MRVVGALCIISFLFVGCKSGSKLSQTELVSTQTAKTPKTSAKERMTIIRAEKTAQAEKKIEAKRLKKEKDQQEKTAALTAKKEAKAAKKRAKALERQARLEAAEKERIVRLDKKNRAETKKVVAHSEQPHSQAPTLSHSKKTSTEASSLITQTASRVGDTPTSNLVDKSSTDTNTAVTSKAHPPGTFTASHAALVALSKNSQFSETYQKLYDNASGDIRIEDLSRESLGSEGYDFAQSVKASFDEALYQKERLVFMEQAMTDLHHLKERIIDKQEFGLSTDLDKFSIESVISEWALEVRKQERTFDQAIGAFSRIVGAKSTLSPESLLGSLVSHPEATQQQVSSLAQEMLKAKVKLRQSSSRKTKITPIEDSIDRAIVQYRDLQSDRVAYESRVLPLKNQAYHYAVKYGAFMQLNKSTFVERRKQVAEVQLKALNSAYEARKVMRSMEEITGQDLSHTLTSSSSILVKQSETSSSSSVGL